MKKLFSLLRACMTDGMQLFRFGKKQKGKKGGIAIAVMLVLCVGFSIWGYANMMIDSLLDSGLSFVVLTLFVLITSILTLAEGIYKSGSLLFNCTDDNLLLALPIKKSTVFFVRIFKFYVFELLYNALFLVPVMLTYAMRVEVGVSFYLASLAAIIFLPVIPVIVSCVIGGIVANVSAKFKLKNLVQIVVTTAILLLVLVAVGNIDVILAKLAEHASSINDLITKLYYPAGAYIGMVTDFNVINLVVFVLVNIALFTITALALGRIYYKINSKVKIVKARTGKTEYHVKSRSTMRAIIHKELKKFVDTPVFVINAGYGLVLFVVGCILLSFNFESITGLMGNYGTEVDFDMAEMIMQFAPAILFGLICMASLMSSITSSVISLEGKSFNILKSIPVKPITIMAGKVLAAVLIMLPFILVGDLIVFIKYDFNFLEILLILLASVILPLVAEGIGIIINLKYPKMNALNDTEVVKQSMSAMVATFLGMGMTTLTAFAIIKTLESGVPMDEMLLSGVGFFVLVLLAIMVYLKKVGVKKFNEINTQ